MEVHDRIRKIREDLFKGSNIDFANTLDEKPNTTSNWISGNRKIGLEVIEKILARLPQINSSWLLSGEGSMMKTDSDKEEPYLVTKAGVKYFQLPNGKYLMRVPFVPVKAYAKYIDEYRDAEYSAPLDEYNFIVDQIGHGRYMAFEIKGDSMDDDTRRSLGNGDIVLGRELGAEHWRDKLHTNDYPNWIIVLDNTILCKQIIHQDVEKATIVCHSLNPSPEYSDFELNFKDIRYMFNIIQRVSNMV
ncbi:MAG: XRE family transcriptional regulator [Prevotella sp.]|jgi:phage repressor protein C with HTH and peptisase S24 domain|nr:XRE family transcriptional regulator [Prevotella sp.]